MKTSCNRVVKSATIVFLAMLAFVTMGVVPAHALVDADFGVTATAKAGEAGQGTLTIVPAASFPGPVTVTVFVVGTGGTLAGGGFEQPVVLAAGTPVSVAYSCVGSGMELGVRFPGKGGPGFGVIAPCGAVVVPPPAPSWTQSAAIVPGPDGSGNADVLFNNEQSNRAGSFHVTIDGGAPMSTTSVVAGQTKSIPVHAEPGSVIRVYGTKDGTAAPQELAKFTLPKVPVAPAPSSVTPPANQPASTNNLPHASNKAGTTGRQRGEWGNPTFKTGASVPSQVVRSQSQAMPPGAVLAFTVAGLTAIYLIGSVVVRRRHV